MKRGHIRRSHADCSIAATIAHTHRYTCQLHAWPYVLTHRVTAEPLTRCAHRPHRQSAHNGCSQLGAVGDCEADAVVTWHRAGAVRSGTVWLVTVKLMLKSRGGCSGVGVENVTIDLLAGGVSMFVSSFTP